MFYRITGKILNCKKLGEIIREWTGSNPHDYEACTIAVSDAEKVFYDLATDAPIVYFDQYCKMGNVTVYDLSKATRLELQLKAREQAITLQFHREEKSGVWKVTGTTPHGRKSNAWYPLAYREFLQYIRFHRAEGEYPMPGKTYNQLSEERRTIREWNLRYAGEHPAFPMPAGWKLPRELHGYAMMAHEVYPMAAVEHTGVDLGPYMKKIAEQTPSKWSHAVMLNGQPRHYSEVGGMIHLSGLEFPLGRINDPTTPVIEAQHAVYEVIQKMRPGTRVVFLGLKHNQHNHIAVLDDLELPEYGFISVSADGIITSKLNDVAIAVFVGDCVAMRATGRNHKALVHYGWQEAADGTGRNFRQKWLRLDENTVTSDMHAGMSINFHDLPLTGEAISRLATAGLGNFLVDDYGRSLPTFYNQVCAPRDKYKFILPDALAWEINPDSELIDGVTYAAYMKYTQGNTFTDGYHASDRRGKLIHHEPSHRDCYIVM